MIKIIKKFWFVMIIAALFFSAFSYVMYEENKDKVLGKNYNGQDVILTIGDQTLTADMLYDQMTEDPTVIHDQVSYQFQTAILNQAIEVTKEMREDAKTDITNYVIAYFENTYGENYAMYLSSWMANYGFKTTQDILKYTLPWLQIRPAFTRAYFKEHLDEYWTEFQEKQNPRIITHILIKTEDSAKPTDEELAKITAVEEALKTQDFLVVAKDLSEDTGSAINDGKIGILSENNRTSYVPEFSAAAMLLAENEVSKWVQTEYGWHLIKNIGSSKEKLVEEDDLFYQLTQVYYSLTNKILLEKGQELGINFYGDSELEKLITEEMVGSEE